MHWGFTHLLPWRIIGRLTILTECVFVFVYFSQMNKMTFCFWMYFYLNKAPYIHKHTFRKEQQPQSSHGNFDVIGENEFDVTDVCAIVFWCLVPLLVFLVFIVKKLFGLAYYSSSFLCYYYYYFFHKKMSASIVSYVCSKRENDILVWVKIVLCTVFICYIQKN